MAKDSKALPNQPHPHGDFSQAGDSRAGDRVQIRSGTLTGLTGRVLQRRGERQCVVQIDKWPAGVFVLIDGHQLDHLNSHQ
jgi:hypothetical protein